MLALAERQISKVLTITVQAIKRHKAGLPTPKQQVFKLRAAAFIEANDPAIEGCANPLDRACHG